MANSSSSVFASSAIQVLPETEYELATADLVADLLEEIARVMEIQSAKVGLTRSGLALRMGRSKSEITKMLRGNRNLTLTSVARITRALDYYPDITLRPLGTQPGDNQKTWHDAHDLIQQPLAASAQSTYLSVQFDGEVTSSPAEAVVLVHG